MPLYALVDGQPQRVLEGGPRRASCAECGADMRARSGSVRIWHWAHLVRNLHCEAARETEWHLAWKALGADGTQEVKVGRRRADVLAPGGFAVEFQASALTMEEVHGREDDWAAQGGMAWLFRADEEFAAGRITVKESLGAYGDDLVKPENRATLDITWAHAPERVRAAGPPSYRAMPAPVFLALAAGEILFVGGWRRWTSPLTGYGWRVSKDWVVQNLLRGSVIPAPLAEDPAEVERRIAAYQDREEAERRREAEQREHEERERRLSERHRQEAARLERDGRRARRIQLTQQHLAGTGQIPQPEPAQDSPPAPGFVISEGLREWRLAQEAKRAAEAAGSGREATLPSGEDERKPS